VSKIAPDSYRLASSHITVAASATVIIAELPREFAGFPGGEGMGPGAGEDAGLGELAGTTGVEQDESLKGPPNPHRQFNSNWSQILPQQNPPAPWRPPIQGPNTVSGRRNDDKLND